MTRSLAPSRLVTSPDFALAHAADGSAYVRGEVEPYPQYWLSERERLLFGLFGRRGGRSVESAAEAMLALRPAAPPGTERRRIDRAISGMVETGVLVPPGGERSRYGAAMARHYLTHRPFPRDLVAHLATAGEIGPGVRALDLAGGPGSLGLALAERGARVTLMELSRGFVAAALAEARRRGVALDTLNESCNRLVQLDDSFDVITVSQALHWLDDVAVCQGVCRTLAAGGSFFVIHAAIDLPDDHPLAPILGDTTPLGNKLAAPFAEQARALYRRLSLLFAALHAPDVERHDPAHAMTGPAAIAGAGIGLFRQRRPIDTGFARAFLSDAHIARLGQSPEAVWEDIAQRCDGAAPGQLTGAMDWAVLHFQRGAAGLDWSDWAPPRPEAIAFP